MFWKDLSKRTSFRRMQQSLSLLHHISQSTDLRTASTCSGFPRQDSSQALSLVMRSFSIMYFPDSKEDYSKPYQWKKWTGWLTFLVSLRLLMCFQIGPSYQTPAPYTQNVCNLYGRVCEKVRRRKLNADSYCVNPGSVHRKARMVRRQIHICIRRLVSHDLQ